MSVEESPTQYGQSEKSMNHRLLSDNHITLIDIVTNKTKFG